MCFLRNKCHFCIVFDRHSSWCRSPRDGRRYRQTKAFGGSANARLTADSPPLPIVYQCNGGFQRGFIVVDLEELAALCTDRLGPGREAFSLDET